jgi:hypothetical protein
MYASKSTAARSEPFDFGIVALPENFGRSIQA